MLIVRRQHETTAMQVENPRFANPARGERDDLSASNAASRDRDMTADAAQVPFRRRRFCGEGAQALRFAERRLEVENA